LHVRHFVIVPVFLCILLSCNVDTGICVDYTDFPEPEKSFFTAILDNKTLSNLGFKLSNKAPAVIVSFDQRLTSWQGSELNSDSVIYLSRICMVYPAEIWDSKNIPINDVSPHDLIPLHDLAPPFVACRINGLDISDIRYPLVIEKRIRFEYKGTPKKQEIKKTDALKEYLEKKIEEARNTSAGGISANTVFRREERPVLCRIAAGGDVMLGRGAESIFLSEGAEGILGGTAKLVKEADLSLINLEGVISGRGEAAKKTYIFRFDPRVAPALKNAGFDAVLFANNHIFDYGLTGFLDSLMHLEKAGVGIVGAGRDIHAAASPFVADGLLFPVKVFGIANYGRERTGWDGLDYAADEKTPGMLHAGKRGAELIKKQLDKNSLNIIIFHGGIEYSDQPDKATRALYTDLVKSGADLVIGTHPHVEQGFEWVEGKPVFWSLGDYVFDEMDDTPGGDKGIFIVLHYSGKTLVHLDVYPLFMNGPRTEIMPDEQLARFYKLTRELAKRE